MKGGLDSLPANIVQTVDHFRVPDGFRREGSHERSFMYSLGVFIAPLKDEDDKHKYF